MDILKPGRIGVGGNYRLIESSIALGRGAPGLVSDRIIRPDS